MRIDEVVQSIVDGGEEADDILRASLTAVHEGIGAPWSAIAFVEERRMVIGPLIGAAPDDSPAPTLQVPITYRGDTIAALWLGGSASPEAEGQLERVATLLAPYCLVGWDTGGEKWIP
ncbi:MAG: hypothetical protein QOI71_2772 [Gaiellales bacterium]|nr:hypothetical protein [Gaiellales bacterium]MDX6619099.1 hypothetical protein [Gaiellales bacterium]